MLPAAGLLIVLTVAAYVPALRGGFVWDDDKYVTANPTLRTTDGLAKIWFEIGATIQYYPLVFTTFWIEHRLWGLEPFGYHLVNVLLHATSAGLLWTLLRRLTVPGAWLAAAVFAIHPVHVESVAWITERKNTLSGVFYLLAVLTYLRFEPPDPQAHNRRRDWRFYPPALVLFTCALLSKTVTCSLPLAIMLLLWWKRARWRWRNVLPVVPMLAIGALMGLLTAWMEKSIVLARGADWDLSIVQRCLIAGRALWFYLGKLVWPVEVMFTYPRWQVRADIWWQFLFPAATIAVVVALWLVRRRVGKSPLVAALFFGGTLAPALGLFDVYPMRYSFVADHFQYLASIGPIVLFVALLTRWLGARAERRPERKPTLRTIAVAAAPRWLMACLPLAVLGILTWRQACVYKSLETLWRDTIAKNPGSWMAHGNLGGILLDRGNTTQAAKHLAECLRINPDAYEIRCTMGKALVLDGKLEEGKAHYRAAAQSEPTYAPAYLGLGYVLMRQHRVDEAIAEYQRALELQPDYPEAHNNLANALANKSEVREAIVHFRKALELRPGWPLVHKNLGRALEDQGMIDQAIDQYRLALRFDPQDAPTHARLGRLLGDQGRIDEAVQAYRAALSLRPGHAGTRRALEALLERREAASGGEQ